MKNNDTPKLDKHPEESLHFANAPTFLVVGTGAVGGFYGAKLAEAGALVDTVHRSDFDEVKKNGIFIESIDGDFHFTPHRVWRQVSDIPKPPDYILVTLKVLPEIDIATIIQPAIAPDTVIILLQNGINIEEPIAHAFPNNEIISALAFICVQRIAKGRIRHLCFGRVTIGRYPTGSSMALQRLADLFEASHTPCHITNAPVTARWSKLVWNVAYNPISVLGGNANTQEIMALPECVTLLRNIMTEAINVAQADGHPLPDSTIDNYLKATREMLPYHTSMALDFMAGRPLEIEAILGATIRAGIQNGTPTPYIKGIYALLKLADQQRGIH